MLLVSGINQIALGEMPSITWLSDLLYLPIIGKSTDLNDKAPRSRTGSKLTVGKDFSKFQNTGKTIKCKEKSNYGFYSDSIKD
jgi:hypothetical protein